MVAALLLKLFVPQGPTFDWLKKVPPLKASNLVYIGLRDVDVGEKFLLKEHNIRAFSMFDVDQYGIGEVMKRTEEYLDSSKKGHTPVHLTFDIDALDPFYAPATGTAVRGGLTYREAHFVCEYLSQWDRLVAMDVVEVNPHVCIDAADETAKCATSLIGSALGESILLR
ncbi:arginase [Reticulomyxa filosa]|uniref:Arginase n=1 Tax=Reticulomyxa filosa TaxID=46433 RepID=X6MUS8_RETFI|nr:arginase [Reticulomyxa filosa]|eukprot:ETO17753.1 arginase [Reticulomyxa filosa]